MFMKPGSLRRETFSGSLRTPFFEKYLGSKSKDYLYFNKAAQIIKSKAHLELDGLENIKKLKINKKREISNLNSIGVKSNKRSYSTISEFNINNVNSKFNEWLAGVIDGDGEFILTKKSFVGLKLVFDIKDESVLYEIKHKYGGSIKLISGANAVRYKLRHKKGLVSLIKDINGLIRNPIRMLQMNKLCVKYKINLKEPVSLTFNNGWLSGFIDSDGSIDIDNKSNQLSISVTQKNKYLLEPLINLYGGKIYILSPKVETFKYVIFRKNEVLNLVDNYFNKYPLKSVKLYRINLIKEYYKLQGHTSLNIHEIDKFNQWIILKKKWDKY